MGRYLRVCIKFFSSPFGVSHDIPDPTQGQAPPTGGCHRCCHTFVPVARQRRGGDCLDALRVSIRISQDPFLDHLGSPASSVCSDHDECGCMETVVSMLTAQGAWPGWGWWGADVELTYTWRLHHLHASFTSASIWPQFKAASIIYLLAPPGGSQ